MDIETHAKKFKEIVTIYNFDSPEKAEELTNFLMTQNNISAEVFAKLFSMKKEDATIFLSFISKGIYYKQNHLR